MFTILLHSSKTMRQPTQEFSGSIQQPLLIDSARALSGYLKTLSNDQIAKAMQVSAPLAEATRLKIHSWGESPLYSLPALDIFLGDIYSGLQVQSFSSNDRKYANQHLYILSGLYGVLRALDTIEPYRLEMGYKLPGNLHQKGQLDVANLYDFWGDAIAQVLPKNRPIINLSAKEYTKAIFQHFKHIEGLSDVQIISPKFLTISPKTDQPVFVTVHAKIARGAFARWLVQERIEATIDIKKFIDLGYAYNPALSSPDEPVFVVREFKGIGLSVRLTK